MPADSACAAGGDEQLQTASQTQPASAPPAPSVLPLSTDTEWHRHLVELLMEDLLEYAKEFPLQIRWIYSELQVSPNSIAPPALSPLPLGPPPPPMAPSQAPHRHHYLPPLPSHFIRTNNS